MRLTLCTVLLVALFFSGAAYGVASAGELAVVDVDRIFRESEPGKAGDAHLKQARDILQKGFEDLRALYKGKEDTAEAVAALREGHAALERQFAADRLAVRQVLTTTLEKVIRTWFEGQGQRDATRAVAPANAFFVFSPVLDVTDAILREMNEERPVFPPLPTVRVRANQANPPPSP